MKIVIVAKFQINKKEDRDLIIDSLMDDIAKAGFVTDDVVEKSTRSDPVFVISGEVPVSLTWKNKKDKLSILAKSVTDSEWLRQFKIIKIEEDPREFQPVPR